MAKNIRLSDHFTYSKLLRFTLPSICMMVFTSIYGVVDGLFVSNFVGKTPFAAINLVMPFVMILGGMGFMIGTGGTALVSKLLGEGKDDEAQQAFSMMVLFTLLLGLVLSAVGIAAMPVVSRFLGATDAMMSDCVLYGRIVTGFTFAFMLQNVFQSFFIAAEKPRLGLLVTVAAGVTNMVLDALFIAVLRWGVAGAAIATVIGQICGMLLAAYFNVKKNTDITLRVKGFRPDWRLIGSIYAIGLPSVIMMAIGSVMTFLMNKILITYHSAHETAATAFGVYFKLNSFIFMPIFGLNNGVIPIVAYNYGAQNRRRMMATIKRSTLYACCIMVFGTVLFWAIPDTLLRLFDASDVMLAAGVPALRIISLSFCMAGACIALGSSFQALGKSMYSMITSIVRQLVFLIPIAYVLARYGASVGNSDLVWWSYPIAEVFSLTLTLVFFSRMYKTIIAPLPEGHE